MKFRIISISKTTENYLLSAEAEYLKRLKPPVSLEITEFNLKLSNELSSEETKKRESVEFLKRIKDNDFIVLLSEDGVKLSSRALSEFIAKQFVNGVAQITFGIGGANGWDTSSRKRADKIISLSDLTFPHQMARLILIEQIYRAISILKGLPYHK